MLHGASQVLFEGVPTHPDAGRGWDIVDKYKVRRYDSCALQAQGQGVAVAVGGYFRASMPVTGAAWQAHTVAL